MWPTLTLIMRIIVGSRNLLWPAIIGLYSVALKKNPSLSLTISKSHNVKLHELSSIYLLHDLLYFEYSFDIFQTQSIVVKEVLKVSIISACMLHYVVACEREVIGS